MYVISTVDRETMVLAGTPPLASTCSATAAATPIDADIDRDSVTNRALPGWWLLVEVAVWDRAFC